MSIDKYFTVKTIQDIEKNFSYVTVVGSFKSLENAQKYAKELSENNSNISILPVTKDGNYRVTAGKSYSFFNLEDAVDERNTIRNSITEKAWTLLTKKTDIENAGGL